jgi:hypothetical protein
MALDTLTLDTFATVVAMALTTAMVAMTREVQMGKYG